jgi:hypothetical protein
MAAVQISVDRASPAARSAAAAKATRARPMPGEA